METCGLIIDNQPENLITLRNKLRTIIDIKTTDNIEEAIEILKMNCNVAFLIVNINIVQYKELLQLIKSTYPDLIIIIAFSENYSKEEYSFNLFKELINSFSVFKIFHFPCDGFFIKNLIKEVLDKYQLMLTNRRIDSKSKEKGFISICSYCKKVKIENSDPYNQKNWEQLELYFGQHFGDGFSHGICPDCAEKHYSFKPKRKKENNK